VLCVLYQLYFYGIIEAFRQGRYPSNQQIDDALQYVLAHSPVDQDQLSPEGRKLIQDCRDIIETARLMVREKNADELFQNFMWNTNIVDISNAKKDPNEVLPADKSKVQDDGRQGRFLGLCVPSSRLPNMINSRPPSSYFGQPHYDKFRSSQNPF
jgi:superfamily I DNA/RNA helicase